MTYSMGRIHCFSVSIVKLPKLQIRPYSEAHIINLLNLESTFAFGNLLYVIKYTERLVRFGLNWF